MKDQLLGSAEELPPVWPDPAGEVQGVSFTPIYKLAPEAAKKDNTLYELLVLVDSVRDVELGNRILHKKN